MENIQGYKLNFKNEMLQVRLNIKIYMSHTRVFNAIFIESFLIEIKKKIIVNVVGLAVVLYC